MDKWLLVEGMFCTWKNIGILNFFDKHRNSKFNNLLQHNSIQVLINIVKRYRQRQRKGVRRKQIEFNLSRLLSKADFEGKDGTRF